MSETLERLDAILGSLRVGVLAVDVDGRVELQNPEASRILGLSGVATLGRPLVESLGAQHPAVMVLETALDDRREVAEHGCRLRDRMGGRSLVVDLTASPVGAGRETRGAVLSLADRTIGLELEDLLGQRARSELFAQLAAGIAHELRNPLGGIRGAAEILASRTSDEKSRDAAALIVREVDRIRSLVDDLLVFHQRDALRLAPLNIHRVLDEVLQLLSMDPLATGVKLERSFDPSIPDLRADADRLTQVFLNLGRNALQALEGEGTLLIETRMALDQRLPSQRGSSLPTVAITVADDGPGIEPELFEQLSTPFFTTRVGGTGLGLAVSRHWVARHGGALRLESEPGSGTRARVFLPIGGPEPEVIT